MPLRKTPLALAIHCSLLGLPALGLALSATAPAYAAEARYQINIKSGPLAQAINQFAQQTRTAVVMDPTQLENLTSSGLQGNFTLDQGFSQLLGDSGFYARETPQGYVVSAAGTTSNSSATIQTLPTVQVQGKAIYETGYSAVDGYIAKQSITAGKSDIPLVETPQTVNVVTADQLTIQNAESLTQALQYTPGISPMGGDHTTSDTVIIRGFNAGASPTYLNGTKLARNSFSAVAEPYTLERVEVLKGPASVLYGNAAPGGIVNMVSKLPQTEQQGELKIQGGSFDRKQLAGDITGSITEDGEFSYRLTGLVRRSDTMTDYVPDDREFIQGSVRWQPTEATSLTLLAHYQNNDSGYVYGLPAEGTVLDNINGDIDRDRFIGEPDFDKFEAKSHTLGYLFSHDINDRMTFRQNFLYFDGDTDWNYLTAGSLDASQQFLSRGVTARADENSSWNIDNQLEIKWDLGASQHTSLVGLDYNTQTFERMQTRGSVAALNLYNPVYGSTVSLNSTPAGHNEGESKQLGLYVQDHFKLDDHWAFMLGGRYDKVKADSENKLTDTTSTSYDDHAFTGRAGLVYLFDNGLAPYISYAESFEPASGQDVNGNAFQPTEGEQVELGLRYQPEGQNLSITASVYKLTQTNVTTTDLDNPGFSIQEGEVESKGFELEAKTSLDNNLNLVASYSYIDNAVTKSNSGTEGNRYGGVPRHAAGLWADYKLTQGPLNGLGLGAGIRYVGESNNLANSHAVPSYTVVDAMVNYSLSEHWDLALNVSNLFDEEYATCSYACFYGSERSAIATATYNW